MPLPDKKSLAAAPPPDRDKKGRGILYQDLFDRIKNGVAVYEAVDDGADFIFKDLNRAGEQMDRVRKADIVGRRVLEVFPGVKEFGLLDVFRRVWRTGEAETHPVSQYKDGRISAWRENYVYKVSSGEIVTVYEDLSKQKQIAEQLEKSERLLKYAFDATRDAIWDWRIDTGVIVCSPAWFNMLGYERDEIQPTYQFYVENLHPDDRESTLRKVQDYLAGKIPTFEFEIRLNTKSSGYKWILARGKIVERHPDGRPARMVGTHVDISEKKRIEKEREAQHHFLRTLLDTIPNPVYYKDLQGRYLGCNRAFERYTKIKAEDLIGKTVFDISTEAFSRKDTLKDQELFEKPGSQRYEAQIPMNTGTLRNVIFNKATVDDSEGRPTGIVGNFADITDRIQMEEKLKESEQRLKFILDTVLTGIIIVDRETHEIVDINPAALQMMGAEKDEVIGRECHQFICPSKRGYCPVTDLNQEVDNSERTLLTKDGGELEILKKAKTIRIKDREYILESFVDISGIKKAQKAVQQENAKFSAMISGMDEGVVLADRDNILSEVNQRFCTMVGRQKEEIIGRRIEDFHDSKVIQKIYVHIDEFRSAQKEKAPVVIQRSLNGMELILRVQPIYQNGEYDGVLLNLINVTDLVEARREAEAASLAKSIFLANMSHEIRTPMNAIMGFTEILDKHIHDGKQRHYLEAIQLSSKSLLNLINDILDLSKVEAGKLEMQYAPFSIPDLIAEIRQLFSSKAEEKGLDLQIEMDGEFPRDILLDEGRLRQVLVNLVGNAVKFTENGFVRLSVHQPFTRKERQKMDLTFTVSDSGMGIPEDQLETVFETFTQQRGQNQNKYGGTGLGLAITRKLVGMMNGHIFVESQPGIGSSFTVILKDVAAADLPDLHTEPPFDPDHFQFHDAAVLIVDDIESNRDLLKGLLQDRGLRLLMAENGREGVYLVRRLRPDVILMDLKMPVMDGYEAAGQLKQDDATRHIPIIAVTASAMKSDEKKIKRVMDDFLLKPINGRDLFNKLTAFLPHTTVDAPPIDDAGQSDSAGPANMALDSGTAERLPTLFKKLEDDFSPVWRELSDTLTINDIEDFAKQLQALGRRFNHPGLFQWAEKLYMQAIVFDVEHLTNTLKEFELILADMKNTIEKKVDH